MGGVIEPALKDEALLRDIRAASTDPLSVSLWWLGQSGFLLKWRDDYLLIDPYLSDSLTRKYAGTATEHIRMTARCVAPEDLGFVTLALSTHAHTDHLDPETLSAVAGAVAAQERRLGLVLSPANIPVAREKLDAAPIDFLPLAAGASMEIGAIRLQAIPAAHTELKQDAQGDHYFVGFILHLGPWTLYHSGDTVLYPGLVEELRRHKPQVMLLPINGHHPERGVAGNLSGAEAAGLAKAAGAMVAIPHHYDMFTFNTATPDEFVGACERLGQRYHVLKCGERFVLSASGT